MNKRPLLAATVCWIVGLGAAYLYSGAVLLGIWAGIVLMMPLVVWLCRVSWRQALLLLFILTAGGLYWEIYDQLQASRVPQALHAETAEIDDRTVQAEGWIASPVEVDGNKAEFELELTTLSDAAGSTQAVQAQEISEKVLVQIRLAAEEEQNTARSWRRGDRIMLKGTLAVPEGARNFGGFDYRKYLYTRQIHWLLQGKGAESLDILETGSWNRYYLLRWSDHARMLLGERMDAAFAQQPHSGYMKGLVLGITEDIDPELYDEFTRLGLTHILAISGMHVAVYTASLLYMLRLLRFTRETALWIVLVLVPAYVLLSGGSPSVVRAGIMAMFGLYAARQGLLKDGLNTLCAAAWLMLLWNPYLLVNVSFQLSFLVTAGLMIFGPLLRPVFAAWPSALGGSASITITAQLVSFPLTIFYFNQFSLLSTAANFVLVPVITFIVLPLGTVSLLLSICWLTGAQLAAWPAERLNELTFMLVRWLNGFDEYVTIWPSAPLWWVLAYYVVLYGLLRIVKRWCDSRASSVTEEYATQPLSENLNHRGQTDRADERHKMRPDPFGLSAVPEWSVSWYAAGAAGYAGVRMTGRIYAALAGLCLCFLLLLYAGYRTPGNGGAGLVQFIDVGQGDSILITTPEGRHLLVDAGGTMDFNTGKNAWKRRKDPYEVGAKTIVPLLKQRGVHQLDALIVTHGDQDHAGGMQAVLKEIPVKSFIFNGTLTGKDSIDRLLQICLEQDIPFYGASRGLELQPDEQTRLQFMHPENKKSQLPVVEEQNEESVVFRLDMAGGSFLFTGDMDAAVERSWIQQDGAETAERGGIDVLKVAHHGSKTSTSEEWLSYWKPAVSVISAGVNNTYGHPNEGVLERLDRSGSAIYRTDTQGEIQMRVSRGRFEIRHKLDAPEKL
ncbi:ComEC/Rec2 family competence protein [Paenibacillus sp. P96]|uniref:ComEC/Rec2 family competence protein n=1 Tax=Paenibacillus zeirhizosphaerae TaxID=2987519 RepID=A0ABT9FQN4_9BACL|nr:ComEC/Rec2 family competence protein [Paenibacillus sp. P96]MDP4097026.1 ComEC/Rec2 family competence protein [Paenibacillus sp. P96]